MTRSLAAVALAVAMLSLGAGPAAAQAEDDVAEGEPKPKPATGNALKTVGAYLLGIGGVALLLVQASKTFGGLAYPATRLSLVNALRTQPNQAELLARNMTGTFGEAIGGAMKAAAMAGSPDPAVIQTAITPSYDAIGQGIVATWSGVIGKSKLYVMAALGGFGLGLAGDGFPIGPFVLAGLAVGLFARLFFHKQEVESGILRARAEVLPEAVNAMTSGRYVFPPQR